ncbi:MAG: peptidoglycan-binding protein [Rhodobacteraceae bacterium]|jgi:hypothetical protein|nr:peptidoglycan-binding protein [Paracoccaceae bacterium]
MLSKFKTTTVSLVTVIGLAVAAAAPAHAWGQRERDTLTGAAGALVLKAIIDDSRRHQAPVQQYVPAPAPRYYPAPRYSKPAAPSIYSTPVARAFSSYSISQRYMIQRQLAYWGYYRGGIDGSFGPGTYSAVVGYARDQGQARKLGSTVGAVKLFERLLH